MSDYKTYCPMCGWTGHFLDGTPPFKNYGKMPDLPDGDLTKWFPKWPWDHSNIEHINILGECCGIWFDVTCKKCRWKGSGEHLLTINELKNIRRTELIDKMLNENIV